MDNNNFPACTTTSTALVEIEPGGMREILDNVRKESTPVVKYPGFEMPSANKTPQNVKYFKFFDYKVKNPPCNAAKEH